MKSLLEKSCEYCKKTFQKKVNCSINSWQTTRFCSSICGNSSRQGKPSWNKGLPAPWAKNSPTSFKKGLIPWNKNMKGFRAGSQNNMWRGGQLKKTCLICSKDFLVDPYRNSAKTCSLDCHKFYVKTEEFRIRQSEIIRSNINQDLQHLHNIVSKFKNLLRRCSKYNMWREKVFNRDDFTCQMCGIRGGKICADHIKPFIAIISNNRIESYENAIKCKEMWDVDNGRTLCLPCHYKTPTFGSKVLQTLSIKRN